jgi:hypothetical protein
VASQCVLSAASAVRGDRQASCTRWRGGPARVALGLTSTTEDRVYISPITDAALSLTGTQVPWSAKQTEVTRQAVLDLCHVIAREVIDEIASNVRDVNGPDLIDQDLGVSSRYDDFRPEHRRLGAG